MVHLQKEEGKVAASQRQNAACLLGIRRRERKVWQARFGEQAKGLAA
jgi:hypothetical protein